MTASPSTSPAADRRRDGSLKQAPADAPLRERKKRRTRQALIDAALEQFTQRGFGGVTLDELCDEVEVSKRTFFRNFTSKEDVAMAPLQDFWTAFLEELQISRPDGGPLLELARDALLSAVDRVADEEWAHRTLLSLRLAEQTPSMHAHSLHFCDRTTQAALEILHRRFNLDNRGDPRPRLAADMLVAAFRYALTGWAVQAARTSEPTSARPPAKQELATRFREAVVALPATLTMTVAPRRTNS
ncbi:TetR/AcrR family transcriptional regulator [Streptomyces cavernae]|uniref:TetR/AcrR family transcriptional regulator n=1 Tax=Streptomyces cavernae TaxID=2259034 RepID=UPI001EE41004|nr:TetR family transcriptional regulator [Streptomyces cavernae]